MTHGPYMLDQPLAVISRVRAQFVVAKPVHCTPHFCWMNPGGNAKLQLAGLVIHFMDLLAFFCTESAGYNEDLHASTQLDCMRGLQMCSTYDTHHDDKLRTEAARGQCLC